MRLLVTGASGLLGINIAYLVSNRFQVIGVARNKYKVQVPGQKAPLQLVSSNLVEDGQVEKLLETYQPDVVINCAALTDVDRCEVCPEEAFQVNTVLPGKLACVTRRNGIQLLHISTDAVFDGMRGNYTEEDQPNPLNLYARSKLEGEYLVEKANPDALIARVNFYGWSWQGQRSLSEWFFNNLAAGKSVKGYNDLIFCPLLANDLIEILLRMLMLRLSGIYHVVSPEGISKFAFGCLLARCFGLESSLISPVSYTVGTFRAPRSRTLTLCSDKLTRSLGEELPCQEVAMQRYYDLYCQEYPKILQSIVVKPSPLIAE